MYMLYNTLTRYRATAKVHAVAWMCQHFPQLVLYSGCGCGFTLSWFGTVTLGLGEHGLTSSSVSTTTPGPECGHGFASSWIDTTQLSSGCGCGFVSSWAMLFSVHGLAKTFSSMWDSSAGDVGELESPASLLFESLDSVPVSLPEVVNIVYQFTNNHKKGQSQLLVLNVHAAVEY